MVAIFKQEVKVPSFLSLREIFHFPWASAVFPAQKHWTSKRHINLQSYTNSQSHASIFPYPCTQVFCFEKYTYLSPSKKAKRSQQWTLKERYGNEGRQHKFKFWKKLLSTTEIRCSCFNEMHLNFNMTKAFKLVSPRGNTHLRLYDSINIYFCLDKCFWGIFRARNNRLGKFQRFMRLGKVHLLEPIENFVSPLILPLNTAQATSTISIHE